MLLTPFRWFLRQLDKPWRDVNIQRQEKDGLIALAVYYFLQIFLYQIATVSVDWIISDHDKKYIQFIQIAGAGLGALMGALLLLRRRSNKWNKKDSIRRLLIGYSIPLVISVLLLSFSPFTGLDEKSVVVVAYLAKFLFGVGWSVGIGCIIIWICEYLPQFLRTSGAIYVGGVGFLGGMLANLMGFLFPEDAKIWMPAATGVIAVCFVALWRQLPEDSQLNYAYQHKSYQEEHSKPDFKSWFARGFSTLCRDILRNRQYRKLAIYSMFIGMGVQYYVKFAYYLEKVPKEVSVGTQEKASNDTLPLSKITPAILFSQFATLKTNVYTGESQFFKMFRYLGMFIGGIFLLRLSWWRTKKMNPLYNKRLPVVTTVLAIQLLLLGLIWIINGYQPQFIWVNTLFAFAIGLTCGIWPLCILAVAEQFSLRDRPIWVLLAPNAYRMADLLLLLMISEQFNRNDCKDLFMIGGIILVFGILSSLGMEDNFDSDALYIRNNEPLNAATIRKQIREDLDNSTKYSERDETTDDEKMLQVANVQLSKHLTQKLKEQFFAVGLFIREENDRIKLAAVDVNPEAYDIYRPNKALNEKAMKIGFTTAAHLAASEGLDSLVRLILSDYKLRGGLIMYSPKTYEQTRLVKAHYLIVNLHSFQINDIETHKDRLENLAGHPEKLDEYIEAFKNIDYQICEDWEAKKEAVRRRFDVELSQGLEKSFAFLRVDAERHFPWRYYLHFIQPYSDNSKVCMLIKTTVPLSTQRLDELHALLTFIELELVNKQLEAQVQQREKIIDKLFSEAEHNRKIELSRVYDKVGDLTAVDILESDRKKMAVEVKTNLQHLIEMAALHVALSRIENGIITPNFDQTKETENGIAITDFGQPTEIDLIDILKNRWRDIEACVEFMNFVVQGHKEEVKKIIKDKSLTLPETCRIKGHYNAIKIILFELLKNAVEKSDPDRPEINLSLTDEGEHALLHISNSISAERYNVLKEREDLRQFELHHNEIKTPGRAGLRSVKRIMRFLNQQMESDNLSTTWGLEPDLKPDTFTLKIRIPKRY